MNKNITKTKKLFLEGIEIGAVNIVVDVSDIDDAFNVIAEFSRIEYEDMEGMYPDFGGVTSEEEFKSSCIFPVLSQRLPGKEIKIIDDYENYEGEIYYYYDGIRGEFIEDYEIGIDYEVEGSQNMYECTFDGTALLATKMFD